MTPRAPAIAWALGGLALAAVLGALLPAFVRPLVVGAIAGGFGAQFARGLDAQGGLRLRPRAAGGGRLRGSGGAAFAALGVFIRGDRGA